ncbi:MAG: zinc ABC transporter substrate-binding protein [Bacillota bacterium]|nr:zinc ABC transporter substrate-binding protein [Bacillota bacterium]MDW7683130.1 zinc ABC transporter substrate-binding protein [Bacillota bacterium]
MKRTLIFLLLVTIVSVFLLTGCGKQPTVGNEGDSGTQPQIVVYTSFYPLYDFTDKIGGERVDVHHLIPAGVDPHNWEPGPQALAHLSQADLLVINGLGMEPWVDKITDSIDGGLMVVNTSTGVEPLTNYGGHGHDDGDVHDNDAHDDENAHDNNDHDDEGDDHTGLPDPHIWLDPLLALHQAEQIAQALTGLDPEHADVYQDNLAEFTQRIKELDAEYRDVLGNAGRDKFIVTHLSFAYLAKRYGLEQLGISGLSPHVEPSPAQMKGIVDFAREHGIRFIFQEPLASQRLASVLAEEINAEILYLNPLEGLSEAEEAAGEDYFSVMRQNLEQLKIALAE